jgi:hypothetical protein
VELREDGFVVMPNHIHVIIWIFEDVGTRKYGFVGARRRRAPTEEKFGKPTAGSIPTIVRAFKSSVTYRANRELTGRAGIKPASAVSGSWEPDNSVNIWQRNYGACPERNEGNTLSATEPITNALPDTSWPTRPIGIPTGKTRANPDFRNKIIL